MAMANMKGTHKSIPDHSLSSYVLQYKVILGTIAAWASCCLVDVRLPGMSIITAATVLCRLSVTCNRYYTYSNMYVLKV